jgi:hypothetical protein
LQKLPSAATQAPAREAPAIAHAHAHPPPTPHPCNQIERTYAGWVGVALHVSVFYPGILMLIFTVLNIAIKHTGSTGAVPAGIYFTIVALWWVLPALLGVAEWWGSQWRALPLHAGLLLGSTVGQLGSKAQILVAS